MNEKPAEHKSWYHRLFHLFRREPQDRQDLLELLQDAKQHHLLNNEAFAMIQGVLQVSEMQVRDVMIPRAQMVVIDYDASIEQALPIIIESAHSRFPVIQENRDEIVGILLAKDLLTYTKTEANPLASINELARPAIFIPESKRLDILLREFRLNRNHMAIVVDEYGGVAGLITIEDVLEQIVGEIEDETDITGQEPNIKQLNLTDFSIRALTPITEFNRTFNTGISNEDFDTIGGYVMQQFGHLPKRGESIVIGAYKITVILASRRRIQQLRLHKIGVNEKTS